MFEFKASRLFSGIIFSPSTIHIDTSGVTLQRPGLFASREETIPFNKIASIQLKAQFIGPSAITIKGNDEAHIHANGFTKGEVRKMKRLILEFIWNLKTASGMER
jgi:hypothetical protein